MKRKIMSSTPGAVQSLDSVWEEQMKRFQRDHDNLHVLDGNLEELRQIKRNLVGRLEDHDGRIDLTDPLSSSTIERLGAPRSMLKDRTMVLSVLDREINDLVKKRQDIVSKEEEISYLLAAAPYFLRYHTETARSSNDAANLVPVAFAPDAAPDFLVNSGTVSNKRKVLDAYLQHIEGLQDHQLNTKRPCRGLCPRCQCMRVLHESEAILVCPQCAEVEQIVGGVTPSALLTVDAVRSASGRNSFSYKRSNHLKEVLDQIQAKESNDVPAHIIDAVFAEVHKQKADPKKVKQPFVRKVLKKLHLSKYYENTPNITLQVSGVPPVRLQDEDEDKIKYMFDRIQEPFSRVCPKKRKNFLSYSYVIRKCCELLGLFEFGAQCALLKSKDKMYEQDSIWMDICKEMKWPFVRSV